MLRYVNANFKITEEDRFCEYAKIQDDLPIRTKIRKSHAFEYSISLLL